MANKRNLLLLLERKLEPVFMEKGENNTVFDVPDNFLIERYKGRQSVKDRFGGPNGEKIRVQSNITIPNLKIPMSLARNENFSLFIPRHRDIASHLISIFMGKYKQTLHLN